MLKKCSNNRSAFQLQKIATVHYKLEWTMHSVAVQSCNTLCYTPSRLLHKIPYSMHSVQLRLSMFHQFVFIHCSTLDFFISVTRCNWAGNDGDGIPSRTAYIDGRQELTQCINDIMAPLLSRRFTRSELQRLKSIELNCIVS